MTFDAATIDDLFFVVLAVLSGISAIGAIAYSMGVRHGREQVELVNRLRQPDEPTEISVQPLEPVREAEPMPRRPLTDEQLKVCLEKNCSECPRCGNGPSGILTDDLEDTSDTEQESARRKYECDECAEKWIVILTPTSIQSNNG